MFVTTRRDNLRPTQRDGPFSGLSDAENRKFGATVIRLRTLRGPMNQELVESLELFARDGSLPINDACAAAAAEIRRLNQIIDWIRTTPPEKLWAEER